MKLFNRKKNDLGIKIVSKDVALWSKVIESRKSAIEQYEEAIKIESAFLEKAKQMLAKAK